MTDTSLLRIEVDGPIAVLCLNRPEKRNAVNDALMAEIEAFFDQPPEGVRVAVLTGAGDHFSAGLDLAEHLTRSAIQSVHHSRMWHRVLEKVEFGGLIVIAALTGAVIGGGLEVATSAHIRVGEPSCFYSLPEARRGIYVGGGASVRVARIIGGDRMREMMLTGRRLDAEDGQKLGLTHYLVGAGAGMAKAMELAETVAGNAELSNYLTVQALTRIAEMPASQGLFTETLATALTQASPDASTGIRAFLDKRPVAFKE